MVDSIYISFCHADINILMKGAFPIKAGDAINIEAIVPEPGGCGNTLIAGRRIGLDIIPVGTVGNDEYGRFLIDSYEKEHIDTRYVVMSEKSETLKAFVLIDSLGGHAFVSMIDGSMFEIRNEALQNTRSLCLSGYMIAAESSREEMMRAVRKIHDLGKPIFFDPGPLIRDIPVEIMDEALECSSALVLNETEAFKITGLKDPLESASALRLKTSGTVVIKAGPEGCYILRQGKPGTWYRGFSVPVVDTTGAGDAFLAAFMHGTLSGWDEETTALFSNAVGAVTVSKKGAGTQVATFDEITAILEKNGFCIPLECKRNRIFQNLSLTR